MVGYGVNLGDGWKPYLLRKNQMANVAWLQFSQETCTQGNWTIVLYKLLR